MFRLRPASWFSSAASWSWQVATGRLDGPYEVRGIVDLQPLREFLAARHDPQRIDANIESGRLRAVSYLLLHRAFTSRLMELGYDDVVGHWPAIERFFARVERRP